MYEDTYEARASVCGGWEGEGRVLVIVGRGRRIGQGEGERERVRARGREFGCRNPPADLIVYNFGTFSR